MNVLGHERITVRVCGRCNFHVAPHRSACLCGGEATRVEYVRADQLAGAVGALREIRERMDKEPDDEMLDDILAIVDGVLYPPTGGQ
jgi:hypothetical protein